MMRFPVILLVLLGLTCSSDAKAQIGGDGGSLRPLPGQNPAMRMVREKVRITFSKTDRYAVLVDYLFRNEGPNRQVAMGVPENDMFATDSPLSDLGGGLGELKISVDGYRTPVRRKILNRQLVKWPEYNALSIIEVPFRQWQTRHIRVRYHSRMWGSCGTFMAYSFAGRRWKGKVQKTSVTMVRGGYLYYDKKGDPGVTSPDMPLRNRAGRSHFQWNHWYPEGAFLVG